MRNIYDLKRDIQDLINVRDVIATLERISASYIPGLRRQQSALQEYVTDVQNIFANLQISLEESERPIPILLVVFSTDHGLVDGLNSRLGEHVLEYIREHPSVRPVVFGQKGVDFLRPFAIKPTAIFPALSDKPSMSELEPFFMQFFPNGGISYQHIEIIAPQFQSALEQPAKTTEVWPLDTSPKPLLTKEGNGVVDDREQDRYSFIEPSRGRVGEFLLEQILRLSFYEKALETKLCEHAARMTAMSEAGKSAGKVIGSLEHQYFKSRQQLITKRLSEVFSAKQMLT